MEKKKFNEIIYRLEGKRIKQGASYSLERDIVLVINNICEEKEISPSHLVNEILKYCFQDELRKFGQKRKDALLKNSELNKSGGKNG